MQDKMVNREHDIDVELMEKMARGYQETYKILKQNEPTQYIMGTLENINKRKGE